jgi:hypothetical protein
MQTTKEHRAHRVWLLVSLLAVLLVACWISFDATRQDSTSDRVLMLASGSDMAHATAMPKEEVNPPLRSVFVSSSDRQSADARWTTLLGRVIDGAGHPLAGVQVELRGRRLLKQKPWQHPTPRVTGADGRFALRFAPPTGHQYRLTLSATTLVDCEMGWNALPAGITKDVGDITMLHGRKLRGRVVDSRGQPRSGVRVVIGEAGRSRAGELHRSTMFDALSGADGRFATLANLPVGRHKISVEHAVLHSPREFRMAQSSADFPIEVIVKPEDELATIRGVVVDGLGNAVIGATIETTPALPGDTWRRETDRQGRFTIAMAHDDATGALRVRASKAGHDSIEPEQTVPWGTSDLRLVMRESSGLHLTVVAAGTEDPVEDYTVWILSEPGSDPRDPDSRRSNDGHHLDGKTTLADIAAGRYLIKIIPESAAILESAFVKVEIVRGVDQRIRVELERPVVRLLRVEKHDGTPVVDARVELLEPMGDEPVRPRTRPVRKYATAGPREAYLWQQGKTDDAGQLELRGPGRAAMTVRVTGLGFVETERAGITLDARHGPIVIRVRSGATVSGQIKPQQFLAQLRKLDGGAFGGTPSVMLEKGALRLPRSFKESFPIGDDGTFEVKGIPPGTWNLMVRYAMPLGLGGVVVKTVFVRELRGLAEGERRRVDLMLAHLVRGEVTGTVLLNGKPFTGSIYLWDHAARQPDGSPIEKNESVQCDAEGRFRTSLLPGHYHARVVARIKGGSHQLLAPEVLSIGPGQEVSQFVFHMTTGNAVFVVVGSDGRPVPGLRLWGGSLEHPIPLQRTGEAGKVADLLATGDHEIRVMEKRFSSDTVLTAYLRKNNKRHRDVLHRIARVHVGQGNGNEPMRIQLPASLGY